MTISEVNKAATALGMSYGQYVSTVGAPAQKTVKIPIKHRGRPVCIKPCKWCGEQFIGTKLKLYCSDECLESGQRSVKKRYQERRKAQ